MNIVEVNGVKYVQKEELRKGTGGKLPSFMIASMMLGGLGGWGTKPEPERPNVDIVEEYGLIQLKKSRLSRSQRDWVVAQFERNFTKLEQ